MVLLNDLFKMLATGVFANIALSRTSTGNINETEYEKVISNINLGIVEIYKRFKFLENELVLHVDPELNRYYLRPERIMTTDTPSLTRYIEAPADTEGFLNFIKITSVFDSEGVELNLNNRYAIPSILEVSHDILQIKNLTAAQALSIVYQSYPNKIVLNSDFVLEDTALDIPETIIDPLLYYVAARVYKPMGSNDSTANADKSAGYEQQYELACQKIVMYGLTAQNNDCPDTFNERGWV
jgi:hypothetical protein